MTYIEFCLTIIGSVLASTGFWTFIQSIRDRKSAKTRMLCGLAHDRIMFLAGYYIKRGYITKEEYEDLYEYLYTPYIEFGGNGSAKHIIETQVNKLPILSHEEWLQRKNQKK